MQCQRDWHAVIRWYNNLQNVADNIMSHRPTVHCFVALPRPYHLRVRGGMTGLENGICEFCYNL